jgi:hypothetical protein
MTRDDEDTADADAIECRAGQPPVLPDPPDLLAASTPLVHLWPPRSPTGEPARHGVAGDAVLVYIDFLR